MSKRGAKLRAKIQIEFRHRATRESFVLPEASFIAGRRNGEEKENTPIG
jgi:hypothetical protein